MVLFMREAIASARAEGRYMFGEPLSKIAEIAKVFAVNCSVPCLFEWETEVRATAQDMKRPCVSWAGKATRLPWYFVVSIPPKRMLPVVARMSFSQRLKALWRVYPWDWSWS